METIKIDLIYFNIKYYLQSCEQNVSRYKTLKRQYETKHNDTFKNLVETEMGREMLL